MGQLWFDMLDQFDKSPVYAERIERVGMLANLNVFISKILQIPATMNKLDEFL